MPAKLTAKQSLFVKEYLVDLNATQAAIRSGYSKHTATEIGYENLIKPHISEAILLAMKERGERVDAEADWVLKTIRETTEALLPEPKKQASNIFKGCELLGKHHKLFTDKFEHAGANGGPQEHKWTIEFIGADD